MENRENKRGMLRRLSNSERKKKILPLCRVCNSPGAGCHYGVVTCGGCKGFFHRALQFHTQYKCEQNEQCDITNAKGKLCQLCRYQACLAAGMSKDAIQTGRYTLKDRTKYILERKGLLNGTHPPKRNIAHGDGKQQGTEFQNDFDAKCQGSPTPSDTGSHHLEAIQMATITSSNLSDTWRYYQHDSDLLPAIGNTTVQHGSMVSIQHNSVSDRISPSRVDTKPKSSIDDYHQDVYHFFDCSLSLEQQKYIMDLYSDDKVVLTSLVDSHERHLGYIYQARMNMNVLEETEVHYETCKHGVQLRNERRDITIGGTDLAAETPNSMFGEYGEDIEFVTRKMVCFIKSVPGFSSLDMSDKVNLIKFGRLEFSLLCNYAYMNYNLGVVFAFSNRGWICPYDLIRYNHGDKIQILRDYVSLCHKLMALNLTTEENVLLKAMAILAPDRQWFTRFTGDSLGCLCFS